jgi:hypothetical protein
MKKLIILIFSILNVVLSFSQTGNGDDWQAYFDSVYVNESGIVNFIATEKYRTIENMRIKNALIYRALFAQKTRMAYVHYDKKNDFWIINRDERAQLLETIDLDKTEIVGFTDKRSSQLIRNQWFLSFGGQSSLNENSLSVYENFRIGTFLMKNRWDIAISIMGGMSGSWDEPWLNYNINLNTRYYQPIPKIHLSPYGGYGIGLNYTESTDNISLEHIFMTGVSWALGPGSLDIGLQYGTSSKFMITLGYTFFPSIGK